MKPQAPCRDCDKRYLGCHSECADYIDYNNKQQKIRDERAARAEECQRIVKQINESRKRMTRGRIK